MSFRVLFSADARKAKKYIDTLKREMSDTLRAVLEDTAYEMQAKAKEEVLSLGAFDNGDLLRSITVSQDIEKKKFAFYVHAGGPTARYAPFIEFGTRNAETGPPGSLEKYPKYVRAQAVKFKATPLVRPNNLPARPYLYPALIHGRKHLGDLLEKAMRKYKRENNLEK